MTDDGIGYGNDLYQRLPCNGDVERRHLNGVECWGVAQSRTWYGNGCLAKVTREGARPDKFPCACSMLSPYL